VIPALDNFEALVFAFPALNPIYQPVLASDPAGPPAGEIAFQRFRLTYSGERRPPHVLY
jgi:hypothetical protein